MDLVLRKRLSLNIYKRQSITDRIRKRIVRSDCLTQSGVTYEVVSNIPKVTLLPLLAVKNNIQCFKSQNAKNKGGKTIPNQWTVQTSENEFDLHARFFAIYKTIKYNFYTLPLMPNFLFGCAGNLHKNTPSTQIGSSAMKEPSWHKSLTVQKHFGFQIFV